MTKKSKQIKKEIVERILESIQDIWIFFIHILVGSVIFLMICGVARIVGLAIDLIFKGTDSPIIALVNFVELSIISVDLTLFAMFVLSSAYKTGRKICKQ